MYLKKVSLNNAPSFTWGDQCRGWWLQKDGDFSVILEKMPPGTAETLHYHEQVSQFFYCLEGELCLRLPQGNEILAAGEGCAVPANMPHGVKNKSTEMTIFLVISSKNLLEDRVDLVENIWTSL